MDTHKNARLTWKGREEMVRAVVDRGMSNAAAARQFNTTPKTVGKWVGRFCAEGVDGLRASAVCMAHQRHMTHARSISNNGLCPLTVTLIPEGRRFKSYRRNQSDELSQLHRGTVLEQILPALAAMRING